MAKFCNNSQQKPIMFYSFELTTLAQFKVVYKFGEHFPTRIQQERYMKRTSGLCTSGLFNFSDFMNTQQKFPVKQCEFATSILPLIVFSQDIVIISVNLLGYFRLFIFVLPEWNLAHQVQN
jgi:hypothetical protein